MSGTIANIIYGIPLTEDLAIKLLGRTENEPDCEKFEDPDRYDFERLYSASGDYYSGYCGVRLRRIFCYGHDSLDEINSLHITDEVRAQVEEKVNKIYPEMRALCHDEIGLYIIWSSD